LKENYRGSYEDFEKRFGSPWYFSHRVDLHNELKRLALQKLGNLRGATLNISTPVIDVDCEAGALTLQNGVVIYKDIIVGADGIHVCLLPFIARRTFQKLMESVHSGKISPRIWHTWDRNWTVCVQIHDSYREAARESHYKSFVQGKQNNDVSRCEV
jgi:2-polyprenyl-6-methoxyphenol hydroxylase-like FAD-dependent oxidoreductase